MSPLGDRLASVRIVTDSSAHFLDPRVIERYGIEVVPHEIRFGSQRFREGVDIDAEAFFHRVNRGGPQPTVHAPSIAEFAAVYNRACLHTDNIVSIHRSRHLGATTDHALAAAQNLLGRCTIEVIDSLTTSAGLAMIVEEAARVAAEGASLDEVIRTVRGVIPRIYTVFYVDTLEYVQSNRLLGQAQAILGTMLGIKPFLTIEEGELVPMEKVRSRAQAIERLAEFVTEFSSIERLVILLNAPYTTEEARLLQDRLALDFPGRDFPMMMYGPSLAAHIGPDGMGVVVFEGEEDAGPALNSATGRPGEDDDSF